MAIALHKNRVDRGSQCLGRGLAGNTDHREAHRSVKRVSLLHCKVRLGRRMRIREPQVVALVVLCWGRKDLPRLPKTRHHARTQAAKAARKGRLLALFSSACRSRRVNADHKRVRACGNANRELNVTHKETRMVGQARHGVVQANPRTARDITTASVHHPNVDGPLDALPTCAYQLGVALADLLSLWGAHKTQDHDVPFLEHPVDVGNAHGAQAARPASQRDDGRRNSRGERVKALLCFLCDLTVPGHRL